MTDTFLPITSHATCSPSHAQDDLLPHSHWHVGRLSDTEVEFSWTREAKRQARTRIFGNNHATNTEGTMWKLTPSLRSQNGLLFHAYNFPHLLATLVHSLTPHPAQPVFFFLSRVIFAASILDSI